MLMCSVDPFLGRGELPFGFLLVWFIGNMQSYNVVPYFRPCLFTI